MRELEFLPQDYIRTRFHRRIGFLRSWLLLALGLVMVLWSLQVGTWVRNARAELQALRGAGFAISADVEKVRMLQAEERVYSRRIATLKRLRPKGSVTGLVAEAADLLPAKAVLEEIWLSAPDGAGRSRTRLRLSGWSPTEVLVTRTLGALEAAPSFDGAVLAESRPGKADGVPQRHFVIEVSALAAPETEEGERGLPSD